MKNISLYTYFGFKTLLHYRLRHSRVIWHPCTPKSASSYLTRILEKLLIPEFSTGDPVPFFGNRRQEPCIFSINAQMGFKKKYYSGHLHTLYTDFFKKKFMNEKSFAIVQTRDLKDTLVSMLDHDRDHKTPPGPFRVGNPQQWARLDDEEKLAIIIVNYVPFHIDFLQSWASCPKAYRVNFNDVTSSPVEVVREICSYTKIDRSEEQISEAVDFVSQGDAKNYLFNKGISGRGNSISEKNKHLIKMIISSLNFSLNSDLDLN